MANKFVRVKDNETGHEYTIAERAVRTGLTVLTDKKAVDGNGRPLAAKPMVKLASGNGNTTEAAVSAAAEGGNVSGSSSGRAADKPKEATK